MAHLQYMPGDPRLVDQLVYELKSKGIFDQFRKDCIADVDTRPAYQNLRQRVENSVSSFLSRQTWQPDLNKNQLREKLRKHILDGNYLEQGVERIVDQVVNPKVASVFIPKVEDLVYNYLGITKKKSPAPETSNGKIEDLLPNDLEAVSPGSVKSNEDKNESMELVGQEESKMEVDEDKSKSDAIDNSVPTEDNAEKTSQIQLPSDGGTDEKIEIPLPDEEIKPENIPEPKKMEVEKIELPREPIVSTDIPLPDDAPKEEKDDFFKPINSDDDDSSSDSSLRRNMSPLTPIRNYNNENSCDAQQAFENDTVDDKSEDKKEPNSFRFAIEAKSPEKSSDAVKPEKKEAENSLAYQFNSQVNINTPQYEDSSNSNILHIDYESDANSKVNLENKGADNDQCSKDSRKEQKPDERRSSHKSSQRSRDSHKHSSSKDKRSDTKQTSSRDSSRQDKSKSSKDETKSKSSDKERSRDRGDRKDSRDSSRQRSSSHKSSHKDSKSHRSSSSSQKHASKSDDKKSTSSQKDKEKSSDKAEKSKDSKSSTQKYDKDRKSSSSKSDKTKSKHDDKDKKNKKDTDDHYSVSGRGNPNRRSTDRDSNDGSSSSKGSNNQSSSKSTNGKKESKSSSKSETTSTSGESTSPSDKENVVHHGTSAKDLLLHKPIVRIESHLETPVASPPRLPFVPDVTIRKPKFAANLEEAKRLMKMRKFLDEEQKRMNQEAALLLEFQANVRPSMSQVYSSIPGPELEFACITNSRHAQNLIQNDDMGNVQEAHYTNNQLLTVLNDECEEERSDRECRATTSTEPVAIEVNDGRHAPELPQNIQNLIYSVDKSQDGIANNLGTTAEKTSSNSEGKRHGRVRNEIETKTHINGEAKLRYFGKNEQCDAEMERDRFTSFFIEYKEKSTNNKLYLINCDSYQENVIRDVSKGFGQFVITNYIKNGHLKLPTTSVIKNVNISREISLPMDTDYETVDSESPKSRTFSPGKSECSFELTSDYDAKLTEMVSKASRQEIMEIILGSALDSSPSRMPRIDYFTDSNIDAYESNMKRKMADETTVNNNIQVLAPNKIRKLSTDQITSTTQEIEEMSTNKTNCTRSKYLGKARRVGLPRPRKTMLPNSPSSDKSVENYEQNTLTQSPNGKIKRTKVQRYDTSDLYKPKLHFLSRRNHIT